MRIRIADKYLVLTKKLPESPKERLACLKEGDELCGLQVGLKGVIPRKRFLKTFEKNPKGKLSAICFGTERVIFKIRFKL